MINSQLGDFRELIKKMLRLSHGSMHISLSNVWICVKLRKIHMMIVSNRHSQEGSAGLLVSKT